MFWRRKRTAKPVIAAQLERERSERLKEQALAVARDLHEIREKNHFAEALHSLIEGGDK